MLNDSVKSVSESPPCKKSSDGKMMLTTISPTQSPPQNFIAQYNYQLTMGTETKPDVALNINLLVRVDIEKAYKLGLEIAKENNAIFNGIYIWTLTNPNRDAQYLLFTTDVDSINKIIEKVKSSLNLTEENLLYSLIPTVRQKEKLHRRSEADCFKICERLR